MLTTTLRAKQTPSLVAERAQALSLFADCVLLRLKRRQARQDGFIARILALELAQNLKESRVFANAREEPSH